MDLGCSDVQDLIVDRPVSQYMTDLGRLSRLARGKAQTFPRVGSLLFFFEATHVGSKLLLSITAAELQGSVLHPIMTVALCSCGVISDGCGTESWA